MTVTDMVRDFYNELESDEHHRFRSWEHCYAFFGKLLEKQHYTDEDIDKACLHLGFYLASWGMYRGSTFLFQKDYKIHEGVVKEILEKKYKALRNISIQELSENENQDVLFDLIKKIMDKYKEAVTCHPNLLQRSAGVDRIASGTLVSKILMGTLGCLPAFDRLFVSGMGNKENGIGERLSQTFQTDLSRVKGKRFYKVVECWKQLEQEFIEAQAALPTNKVLYPIMKVVDMHFWSVGRNIELDDIKNKISEFEKNGLDDRNLNKLKRKLEKLQKFVS